MVDVGRSVADQISQLMFGEKPCPEAKHLARMPKKHRVEVILFTDSKSTLDSLASTHQVENRLMRSSFVDMKGKLQRNEVSSYNWLETEEMMADCLTKRMENTGDLMELLRDNKFQLADSRKNQVIYENGEFMMINKQFKVKTKSLKRKKKETPEMKALEKSEKTIDM